MCSLCFLCAYVVQLTVGKVAVGKNALLKTAAVIIPFLQAFYAKVNAVKGFIFYVGFIHFIHPYRNLVCINNARGSAA